MSDENNVTYYKMMLLLESNKDITEEAEDNNNSNDKPKDINTDEEQENSSVQVSHEFMDELELDIKVGEQYFDDLNNWFDKFDAEISIPNDGFIKYEITNDGLILLLVNQERENVVDQIRKYVKDNTNPKE
ncbi:hypothetical protein HANVADRAFT_2404 [Hanseniaspora valbyensis NRRL Y-1626]|uniref:Uncharacterized protein n=1 Tax=Hanseniaspora valbyensis NRRL Y-1626 TaxID=766949 RepID=A0A1B7TDG7_9ASCO|nr:hypothetical protein HANVADRAFT_2404 [Hanseniaspora valbyensis NRRL Y-1626]